MLAGIDRVQNTRSVKWQVSRCLDYGIIYRRNCISTNANTFSVYFDFLLYSATQSMFCNICLYCSFL